MSATLGTASQKIAFALQAICSFWGVPLGLPGIWLNYCRCRPPSWNKCMQHSCLAFAFRLDLKSLKGPLREANGGFQTWPIGICSFDFIGDSRL